MKDGAAPTAEKAQPPATSRSFALAAIALASIAITLMAASAQIGAGSFKMEITAVLKALFGQEAWSTPGFIPNLLLGNSVCSWLGLPPPGEVSTETLIIWNIRVPRLIVGIAVGINLAFAGSILQAITRNEMASPYLLGISHGAGLMIIVTLVLLPQLSAYIPIFAMLGGILTFFIVYAIAWNHGASPVRLILAGIIVGSVAGAIQTALHFFIRDMAVAQTATSWTAGSLVGVNWQQVRMILPWTVLTVALGLLLSRKLDILLLGDQTASSLGLNVERWRFIFAIIAIMAAAASVSVVGLVGFVGLIVPHIVRSMVGSVHSRMFIGCLFAGPALLVCADAVARLLLSPIQLPVGTITGTIGGVFFLFLMRRKREFGRL